MDEQLLKDLVATANNPEYGGNWNIISSKFPELKQYDQQLLKDYVATANNPKYRGNWNTINSKFPEFGKKQQPVKPKGVSTGQNTASQSASVNGGFSSGSSEVRPQSKSGKGLVEKPKTILQKMQDDAMSRPKIGEEVKTKTKADVKVEQAVKRDEQNWSSNKPIEQKVKTSLKPVVNQPVKKEKVVTQAEFDKNRYSNFDYKYDNPDFKNVAPEELSKTEQHFTNVAETGIDPSDFSRYLKNKTEFFDRDPNYRDNDSEKLRKSFESDSYLRGYVQDRASFLENKMKYAKTDEEKQKVIVEYNKLGQGYAQYKQKYFPDLVKKEEDLKKRNTEIYNRAKSGEGNALYQTGKVITSFAEGAYKPIEDILQAGIENLDEGFKKIGFDNGLGEGVERGRFAKSYRDMVNDDGFGNVYGKGKEVKYGKDTFIVTENGSVVDKQTGSSVNNIFDSGTIKKITDLSNSSTKESSYFSGVSLTKQVASTAGQMITQIAATRGMGGGAAMTTGSFAKSGAIVNATLLSTSAYNETVTELLKAGVSESDARASAAELSVYMAGVGALTGALSPNSESAALVGQKFKNDIVKKAVTAYLDEGVSGIKGFIKNATKELPNALKETGLENVQELVETKSQNSLNEDINDRFGIKALQEDMTMEDAMNIMLVTSFSTGTTSGAGAISKGVSGMFGMDMKAQFDAVSEMNDDDFVKSLKVVVNQGAISPERASEMVNEVRNYRNYKNKLKEGVNGRKAIDATQLMAERDDLKRQKKNLDEAFHPELDAKIEEVNNKISKVLNGKEEEEAATSTETGLEENTTRPEGESDQGKTEVQEELRNFDKDVKRITDASEETEDGHTFNLDGTTYDQGGLVIPVVSKNMKQSELTSEKIQEFVNEHSDKIDGNAVKVGIYKFPNSDDVSIDLNIVAPTSMRDEAIAFGREAGQESLFDLDTFENVKTGADGKNPKSFTSDEFKEIAKKFSNESNQTKEQSSEETGGNKEGENTSKSENVRTYVDSPARFKNQKGELVEGVIKQDGQRVVVETDNEIYDIGNIDEVGDKSLEEMNLTVNDPVTLSEDGKVQVRGKNYTNNFSDPKQAINRDSDGKIISVNLESEDGQKRTFRNQMAEDVAYQIYATEFTKSVDEEADIAKPDVFDKFIKNVDDLIDAIDRHTKGTLSSGIFPIHSVAKGALKVVRATAVTTRDTVKAINAGIEYMKSTDWYKGLTQEQKKEFESKTNGEIFDELLKSAKKPEQSMAEKRVETVTIDDKKSTKSIVRENTGQTDKSKKITMTEAKALKDKFKNLQRGFKQGVKDTQQLKRDFVNDVKEAIKGLGNHITETDAKTMLNQVANVNEKNIDKVSAVIDNLVARLENRAQKAKIAKLSKLQKRAGVKARTKYGNAGGNINNLIKIPANQIPDAKFDEYYETIEKLSKGEPVDFDKVNQLYEDLKGDIQDYVDRKNQDKVNPKPKDQDKLDKANDEARDNLEKVVNGNMRGKNNLTDFEKATMKKFMNIPLSYLQSLPTAKMNEITKALQHYQQTGYMSNKVLADVVMKYNSEKTTAEIMGKVGDTLLKPARGIIGMIDGLRSKDFSANDFFEKISLNMLHHIDSVVKGVKGTLFYDNIVHPITSNFNKSDAETNKIGHKVAELLGKAAKSSGSGFRTNVKIQMFVRQREFESNPELRGTKVYSLDEHMKAMKEHENNTDYVQDDLEVIYEEYDNVKGKTSQEMYDGLTKEEKALVDFMDKELEQQEIANRDYNNHLLGETLTYPKNYFPKKNSFVNGNPDDNAEIKARLFGMTGATSVKADASNERVATGAHPLNFNSTATFMGNVRQSHIEKNLAFPVKQTLMTITNLKKSDNKSLVKVANALEKTVKQLLEVQLGKNPYSYDSKAEQIFNKFTRNTFTRMLIDPIRLSHDIASNYGTVYAAFADKLPQIKKATKNINDEVNEMIHKNISSTQSERMGGSRSSDYKNAMSSPVSKASNMKANPSFREQLVDLYKNNKVSDFSEAMGDLYYKYADLPAQHLWKYYMSDNFKKITGKEFDGKKYLNDKSYREEVQEDLQKASTLADKQTANYFNTGASSEQKLKVQGGKGNMLTRMNNFLRSFTFNENRVFWDSFNGLTGIGDTTFDSKGEAFRAFAVVNARGITYSYLGQMVGGYVLNLVTGADDEEDEEIINKKALKRSLGQHGMLIAAGNKGMIANFVGNFVIEMINEEVVKADKGEYNPYEDNIFYVPNGKSKYTDFLNNLGAEGMAVKSIVDLGGAGYKLADTFRNEGEITMEDIVRFKTAQYTVSFVSQLTGLPIDRLGRLTQKALQKKYPYTSKSGGGNSGASFGSFGSSGSSGFGSFK